MTDKTLAWAIAEIEAEMANAVRQRKYYWAIVKDPRNRNAPSYLARAENMRQLWDGEVLGLEKARRIVIQVNATRT